MSAQDNWGQSMPMFHDGTRRWRAARLLVVALAAFSLTGCTSSSLAVGPTPTTALSTPAPTPDSLSAPQAVFGGDCDAVLTAAEAGDALGTPLSFSISGAASPKATPQDFVVSQVGGLECSWHPDDEQTGAELAVVVLPATFMEPADTTVPYCYGTVSGTAGTGSCSFNVSGSDFWLSGVAYTPLGTTNDDARTAIATLTAQFILNAGTAPEFVSTEAGSWTDGLRTDCLAGLTPEEIRTSDISACACQTLAASAPVAAVLADTGITPASGNGPGEFPLGFYRALGAGGNLGCLWSTAAPSEFVFATDILPGGAWVQTQLAALPGVTQVDVEGIDRALLSDGPPELGTGLILDVFDGPNWLQIDLRSMKEPESFGPLALALVAALNEAG